MIKINLYGGPGCGKSTLSALLFTELKLRGLNTELVREFAKELVYEDKDMINLKEADRIFIMAEQMRREAILHGKVDYLITDSPVLIAAYYYNSKPAIELAKNLMSVFDQAEESKEYHFYISRGEDDAFEQYGRAHGFEESKKIDKEMMSFLNSIGVKFYVIKGNPNERLKQILKHILLDENKACISINKDNLNV